MKARDRSEARTASAEMSYQQGYFLFIVHPPFLDLDLCFHTPRRPWSKAINSLRDQIPDRIGIFGIGGKLVLCRTRRCRRQEPYVSTIHGNDDHEIIRDLERDRLVRCIQPHNSKS